jgi:hypothetical protein
VAEAEVEICIGGRALEVEVEVADAETVRATLLT